MFLGKTKDTWKKELVQLFFFCLYVAAFATLVYGISIATGKGLQDVFQTACKILFVAFVGRAVWKFFLYRMARRVILLDLGRFRPFPARDLIAVAGLAMMAIPAPVIATPFLAVAFVAYVQVWCERLLFVKDGIWFYGSILKWQDIESYEWKEDSTLILKSHLKRYFLGVPVENELVLPIPLGQRETVSQLLEQYLCKQTTSI